LDEFGIPAKVVGFRTGPTVTQFAVEPGYIDKSDDDRMKIRVSQISSLQRDLALALSAQRLRIEAPVPGKSYVGIEIPNPNSAEVQLRPLIESEAFYRINSPLALTLGRDVSGRPVVADLATMPHLLIAGTTGSGKSVCITALTACLVMNNTPAELKLAMIDPKRVELMRFNGLPHLMGSVETEIDRILGVLRWATTEMDYRYKLLEKARARNIDSYNKKMERQGKRPLPKIVIVIDEMADLMMSAPDQTEHALVRLAQKARAIGIHLILATQRPSTDVVTGLIKANFPTRISFTVATSIDSRVILDTGGAETLLGRGDMLFLHPEIGLPMRAQGVIVSDSELNRIIRWWKKSTEEKEAYVRERYDDSETPPWEESVGEEDETNEDKALIREAINLIKSEGHASASYFQRQLRVGYPRAARLVDQLEEKGIIGPSQGGGREREILIDLDEDASDE
jgi:S-DNA-T family DNA segregation ATPase FtsK/SpoIIIE